MKKFAIVLGIIIFIFIGLAAVKNQIIKSVISVGATTVTGVPVHINNLSFSLLGQSISIKGFKMYNPKEFPKEILIDITTLNVDYDLGALLRKKLHLRSVEIDLEQLNIVRNKEGKLNVDSLKVAEKQEKAAGPKEKKPSQHLPMQIDELILSVGRVVYKDFTKGEQPSVEIFDVGIKRKIYKNITSAQQLTALILTEPLKQTAIQGAKIYAASAILGVGFLPAGVAVTLLGKDSTQQSFDTSFEKAYEAGLSILEKSGRVTEKNKEQGLIKAVVNKNDVIVKIEQITHRTTQITIAAKRLLLPKPEVAKDLLYQISENIK